MSLFVYDNGTFIVHNFRDEPVNAAVTLRAGVTGVADLVSGEKTAAERTQGGGAPWRTGHRLEHCERSPSPRIRFARFEWSYRGCRPICNR